MPIILHLKISLLLVFLNHGYILGSFGRTEKIIITTMKNVLLPSTPAQLNQNFWAWGPKHWYGFKSSPGNCTMEWINVWWLRAGQHRFQSLSRGGVGKLYYLSLRGRLLKDTCSLSDRSLQSIWGICLGKLMLQVTVTVVPNTLRFP